MLNVSEAVKTKYLADEFNGPISIVIDGTTYTSENVLMGSLEITESLCSGESLDFPSAEKGRAQFSFINIDDDISGLKGEQATIYQTVAGEQVPLGVYTIDSAELNGDYLYDVVAFDNLAKLDVDISSLWNDTIVFPITARDLLITICTHCGLSYSLPATYCNSDFPVEKNISVQNTTALEFLGYLQEVSGCFFRCDRSGTLKLITVGNSSGTPDQIYDYSLIAGDLTVADYNSNKVDKLQIRGTKDDIGVIVGTGTNAYVIQANPLLYSLDSSASSTAVAENILNEIKDITYRPFEVKVKALPYIEIGDLIKVTTYEGNEAVSPLFCRTMSGIGIAFDSIKCKGVETRTEQTAINKKIKILNQRTLEIRADVEEFSTELTEIRNETTTMQTEIQQNSDNILLQSSRSALNNLLLNSNFSDPDNAMNYWTLYPPGATAQVIGNDLFGVSNAGTIAHGKALELDYTPTQYNYFGIFQKVNINDYVNRPLHVEVSYRVPLHDGSAVFYMWVSVYGEDDTYFGQLTGYRFGDTSGESVRSSRARLNIVSTAAGRKVGYIRVYIYGQSITGHVTLEINNVFATFSDLDNIPWWTWNDYSKADVVSQINLSPDGVLIKGEKIDIQGITTFSSSSGGTTVIDGGTLTGQTISSVTMNAGTLNSGTINSTSINGGTISGSTIKGGQFQIEENSTISAKMYGKNLGSSFGGYGFCIDGTGGLALDCSHILIAPTQKLWVKTSGGGFSQGLQGDVTFKNWNGDLYKLTFTNGIAWYYASTAWSTGGGYNGTINGMYFKNGILQTYNGHE